MFDSFIWFAWQVIGLGAIVVSLAGAICAVAAFLFAAHWLFRWTWEWKLVLAFYFYRMADRNMGRAFLERYHDPDKRYERERDELREQLRQYRMAELDIRDVARRAIEHYGNGTEDDPHGTEDRLDWVSLTKLAECVESAIIYQQRREQSEVEWPQPGPPAEGSNSPPSPD